LPNHHPDVVSKGHGKDEEQMGPPVPEDYVKPSSDENTVNVVGKKDEPPADGNGDNKWLMAAMAGLASHMMSKDKIDREKSQGMTEATKMMYSPWTGMKGETVVPSSYAGNMASNMTNFLALYQNYLKSKNEEDKSKSDSAESKAKTGYYNSLTGQTGKK
jgi:hypothetical protein